MKKYIRLFLLVIMVIITAGCLTISKATVAEETTIQDFLMKNTTIDFENFKESDIITIVEELTSDYTTEELADILEQYKGDIEKTGLDEKTFNNITNFLRETDTSDLRKLLKEIDLDEIKTEIEKGEELSDVIGEKIKNMPAEKLVGLFIKALLTNKALKNAIIKSAISSIIITIYMIVVRWIIYKKAGKHGWAAIIPIYKDVVWLKIAGLSPWLLLLFLIPIFGWIALAIIFIVSKFKVPVAFGKDAIWGLGLWFVPIVFESVIAFSKDFEYKKDEENENIVEAETIE